MFLKFGPAWKEDGYTSRGGQSAVLGKKNKKYHTLDGRKTSEIFRAIFHPELESGLTAIFHLVFVRRAHVPSRQLSRGSLFGIGADAEQSDDISHCLFQVLPEAMRICLRAGELGRYVEIDEVLSHQNVRHTVTVVGNRSKAPSTGHVLRISLQIKQLHLLLRGLAG